MLCRLIKLYFYIWMIVCFHIFVLSVLTFSFQHFHLFITKIDSYNGQFSIFLPQEWGHYDHQLLHPPCTILRRTFWSFTSLQTCPFLHPKKILFRHNCPQLQSHCHVSVSWPIWIVQLEKRGLLISVQVLWYFTFWLTNTSNKVSSSFSGFLSLCRPINAWFCGATLKHQPLAETIKLRRNNGLTAWQLSRRQPPIWSCQAHWWATSRETCLVVLRSEDKS